LVRFLSTVTIGTPRLASAAKDVHTMATNRAFTGAQARMSAQEGGSREPQKAEGGGGAGASDKPGNARVCVAALSLPPPPARPTTHAATPQKEHWNRSKAVGAEKPKEERAALLRRTMAVDAGLVMGWGGEEV